jgi:hypothetical protein
MRPNRRFVVTGVAIATAVLALIVVFAPVAAADDCKLTVKPQHGPPGTQFVFTGRGFTPTVLRLKQDGRPAKSLDLSLGDQDPFTIKLLAGEKDTGRWRATATDTSSPDGCSASTTFRVTLPSTATVAAGIADTDRTPVIAALGLLALVFVVASATLLPRIARAAGSR